MLIFLALYRAWMKEQGLNYKNKIKFFQCFGINTLFPYILAQHGFMKKLSVVNNLNVRIFYRSPSIPNARLIYVQKACILITIF